LTASLPAFAARAPRAGASAGRASIMSMPHERGNSSLPAYPYAEWLGRWASTIPPSPACSPEPLAQIPLAARP